MDVKKRVKENKKKLLDALERSLGIITPACKEVGVSRDTFYRYYNEDEKFKESVDEINDLQGDFVENQLFKKIKDGSERSILFYMKYKGKNRGYSSSSSLDITSKGESLSIKNLLDFDDDSEDKSEV